MVTRNVDSSQGDGGMTSTAAHVMPAEQLRYRAGNTVFKSGPLFISSKGIGWTSWKKRWFILTRTSLVFFRSDPSALPQKGSEVNLTLGGIDLNNSGSVVVREDKKLLTVLFPDGRDGRAFTLKAETSENMYEWKTALENALAQAPNAALVMGQNTIFRNDTTDIEGSLEHWRDRKPVTSLVVGRPILLALEDIDGGPSFLEKALRFIEQYGIKVEGILRQSADVEEVERRVQEYEQGKNEFSPDEDAHVVGDCVKHVLRELPSSPVPASCCTALLEAYRTERGARLNAMQAAISETFPEPNRHLLQRILKMMQTVASHKSENRMTSSAVAACMAPLLLRPLLAGECELEDEFDMGDDGSAQLLQAAAAANHAQAIVIGLLEEYDKIFLDDHMPRRSFSSELYSQSEDSGSEDEEATDDEILENDGYHDAQNDLDLETDDDRALSGTLSESSGNGDSDLCENKVLEGHASDSGSPKVNEDFEASPKPSNEIHTPLLQHDNAHSGNFLGRSNNCSSLCASDSHEILGDVPASASPVPKSTGHTLSSCITKSTSQSIGPSMPSVKRPAIWGRTSARKNLSMESIDYSSEDEIAIQKLEIAKNDLQNKISKEAKGNSILQASLERRKQALHERRIALEQDVARLQEQLQRERDLRETLEAGLNMPLGHLSISSKADNKTRADLEEIALAEADVINLKQKIADLHVQLNQQRQHNYDSACESCSQHQHTANILTIPKAQHTETTTTRHHERSLRSEDYLFGVDRETVGTLDSPSLLSRLPPQKPQRNSTNQTTTKSSSVSTEEPLKVVSNASKKPAAKGELHQGTVSTSSALTKLTTRLNFLKERRTQLVNELQTLETGGSQGSVIQPPGPPPKTNSR